MIAHRGLFLLAKVHYQNYGHDRWLDISQPYTVENYGDGNIEIKGSILCDDGEVLNWSYTSESMESFQAKIELALHDKAFKEKFNNELV